MPQDPQGDWFQQNAPKNTAPASGDWFADNAPTQQQGPPQDYLTKTEDFIHGAAGGALKNIPILGKYFGNYSQAGVLDPDVEKTGETAGRIYEQGLELAATGGPLKAGAETLATKLPWLGRLAAPLTRIAAESVNTGANAAIHGQPVGTSAVLGAGGATLGEVGQAVAPKLVESALGVTSRLRGQGRTIGQTVLDQTSAVRMSKLGDQIGDKLSGLNSELEARADAAGQQGVTASTQPALNYLDQQISKYSTRNSPFTKNLQQLRNQLTQNEYTGQAIPQNIAPRDLLELKRGIGDAINSWEPSLKKSALPLQRQVYRILDNELDRTVPGAADLNQQMSSLIPANMRADIQERSASLPEDILDRITRPTGAMAGAILGGQFAGPAGAVAGPIIQSAVKAPAVRMGVARAFNSNLPPILARGIVASQQGK